MNKASLLAGILLFLVVAAPAHARRGDDGQAGREAQRQEERAQEQDQRRRERLSPEERQELRRDIRDFGRDIYRPDARRRFRDR